MRKGRTLVFFTIAFSAIAHVGCTKVERVWDGTSDISRTPVRDIRFEELNRFQLVVFTLNGRYIEADVDFVQVAAEPGLGGTYVTGTNAICGPAFCKIYSSPAGSLTIWAPPDAAKAWQNAIAKKQAEKAAYLAPRIVLPPDDLIVTEKLPAER